LKNNWSNSEAKKYVSKYKKLGHSKDMALRVYTTRLLGRNSELVLHGGGNTSVKTNIKDIDGKKYEVLCVKGSGWDMAEIEPEGLPAVKLQPLLALKNKKKLSDEDMVAYQKRNLLDIKLIFSIYSDISIVGLPNAGKSTLIQKLTNSKAKIGDYEFTTTSPNIGVLNNLDSLITICDLPGLIQGASDGVGMGRKVLKHLRNTKFIVYLIDPSNENFSIDNQISMLSSELNKYDENYRLIKNVKVINKSDTLTKLGNDYLYISCLKDEGIDKLVKLLHEEFKEDLPRIYSEYHKIFLKKEDYNIEKTDNQFICSGEMVSNMVNISGNNDSVLDEIFFRFEKSVLSTEIDEMGAVDGDIVVLGNLEFEYKK